MEFILYHFPNDAFHVFRFFACYPLYHSLHPFYSSLFLLSLLVLPSFLPHPLWYTPFRGLFPLTLPVGTYDPPYPWLSSYLAYIYIHFLFITHLDPEDGDSTVLWNIGIQPPHYTTQQPRKTQILPAYTKLIYLCPSLNFSTVTTEYVVTMGDLKVQWNIHVY